MARPTRIRRPPLKFSEDENILESKSRKTRDKIAVANGDNKETANDAPNIVTANSRFPKGNLLAAKKTVAVQAPRSPVLRDRTNLPAEPFKVDILVKKGANNKKTTAKVTRQTTKAAVLEEVKSEAPGRTKSSRQTKAENLPQVKEATNLPPDKEKAQKVPPGTGSNLPLVKETAKKRLAKEKTKIEVITEKAINKPARGTTKNELVKEQVTKESTKETKKIQAKEMTNPKMANVAATSDNEDNSLVIESENATDAEEAPKMCSAKATPKKIRKRVAFSKLSLSKQANKSVENRKKALRRPSKLVIKTGDIPVTSQETTDRKFFKSKGNAAGDSEKRVSPGKKIATSRGRKVGARATPRVSTSFRLRQPTVGESFARYAARKNLRPRAAKTNYHEQSTVHEKTATTEEHATKGPVYKTAKLLENNDENGSEVYEFHFDSNDSRERAAKKRKRKVGNGVVTKKTRTKAPTAKSTISKAKPTAKSAVQKDKVEELPRKELPAKSDKPMDANDIPAIIVNDFHLPPITTTPTLSERAESQPKEVESTPKEVRQPATKPMVVESLQLPEERRISLTTTPQLAKSTEASARPLRTTNAFNIRPSSQYRTMVNHVLLNKSLSPIKKAMENFDPGSPWRPPAITGPQFSRVKNVVQSTPHQRKFSAMLDKNRSSVNSKPEPEVVATMKITKIVEKNENNVNVEQASIRKSPQKVFGPAKSPRKFGTVISNVNPSNSVGSPVAIHKDSDKPEANRGSPHKVVHVASPRLADVSESRLSDGHVADDFDDHVDKENSVPIFTSPKKALKSPRKFVAKQSTLRALNPLKPSTKENWEPQPGPSGLQKRSPLGESRILRQSNLNNFLNIDEMPTSTRISGAHGIFAEAHSTPIAGKPVKLATKEPNLENAFGFDDIGNEIDLSPIKTDQIANPIVAVAKNDKKSVTVPSRFSIGEIKKHLRPIKEVQRRPEGKQKEKQESSEKKTAAENEQANATVEFSDTFDVLSKPAEEEGKENVEEIPLFADLEPVHFKQPPRHSYKRKRIVAFNVSGDEDEESGETTTEHEKHEMKKRKISKVEKQRQKKMEEWAKDLNHTFEEIDHFDLVVE